MYSPPIRKSEGVIRSREIKLTTSRLILLKKPVKPRARKRPVDMRKALNVVREHKSKHIAGQEAERYTETANRREHWGTLQKQKEKGQSGSPKTLKGRKIMEGRRGVLLRCGN